MAKNSRGEEVAFAEMDSAALLSPNLESRLRLAAANLEEALRTVYGQVSAAEQELVQIRNVIGRAERVPIAKEAQ